MPLATTLQEIAKTEASLGVAFPAFFKERMCIENGGEVFTEEDEWSLFPFLDETDDASFKRTSNHIAWETLQARNWAGFPQNGVAIGGNGFGDYLVLLPSSELPQQLMACVYCWMHESWELLLAVDDTLLSLVGE